jgi:hypothetical protein
MSEVRWNEFGEMKTPSSVLFLYSGRPNAENEHRKGVGLLLSKRMLDWKPVIERIIIAHFQGHACNITVIQYYAPTEAAEIEIKQSFCAHLQEKRHCYSYGRPECTSGKQ